MKKAANFLRSKQASSALQQQQQSGKHLYQRALFTASQFGKVAHFDQKVRIPW